MIATSRLATLMSSTIAASMIEPAASRARLMLPNP